MVLLPAAAELLGGWGAGLCRPSVFRDENRELTGMYLQRVGMALHPSTTWQGFAAGTYQRGGWYIYAKRFSQGGGKAVSNEELFFKGPRRRSACQRKGAAIS